MRLALDEAGVEGTQVAHVNAHGTSTPAGDLVEAQAIRRVCGPDVVVSATKSMTGHLLGGAGAMEAVFTILALRDRIAPPTINLSNPEPDLTVRISGTEGTPLPEGELYAINNAFGFGGHNVALLLKSWS